MKQIILFILVLLPVCAFAQFTETFDGPEVNSANPWEQSADNFYLKDGQLLFDASGRTQGSSYIHVPITYSADMEWEFDVSLSYNPSTSNHARVYVYATNKPSDVSFYVQIGHNDDNVSLYTRYQKNEKENVVNLIKGRKGLLNNDRSSVRVKLTKERDSLWTLYTRLAGTDYYVKEGTAEVSLSDLREGGYLNLACRYKASSKKDVITAFDNVSVLNEITSTPLEPEEKPNDPDPDKPVSDVTLQKVEPLNLSLLQFTFDMPVEIKNAHFSVTGLGDADRVSYADMEIRTVVNVSFSGEMEEGKEYTVSYTGVMDFSGNLLESYSAKFVLTNDDNEPNVDPEPLFGSVLINEIMADTAKLKLLPHTEYVELYNATDVAQPLKGYSFIYDNRITVVLPDVNIPAKGYAILYRAGREITIDQGGVGIPLDRFPAQLANAGKLLQLKSPLGSIIDEYAYPKATPAKSWERSPLGDWHLSSDPRGGTPGSVNSSGEEEEKPNEPDKPVTPDEPDEPDTPDNPSLPDIIIEPKEFIFNELLPNPFAGGSEYFELYNRSGRSLPLSGLSVAVRKTDGTLSTRYPLSSINTLIEPDDYAVLTKSVEGVADFYMVTSPATLFEISKLPILANTSSTLVLFRTEDGTIIDEVSYSSKWHASSIKDQKGVALERIDPEAETQSPSNWTSASATAGYGTPGYRNSQSDISFPNEPDKPTGIEAPEWVPGSEHYKITYYLDQPGYSCRAFVFNTIGQRVAEIANHELLGLSGELTWDGESLAGSHLRTGVYIFYAELYHTSGTVKRYKQVFLVR